MNVLTLVHSKPEWPGRVVDLSVLGRRWMLFCCVLQSCYCSWECCDVELVLRVGLIFTVAWHSSAAHMNPTLSTSSGPLQSFEHSNTISTHTVEAGSRLHREYGTNWVFAREYILHSHRSLSASSFNKVATFQSQRTFFRQTEQMVGSTMITVPWEVGCTQRNPHASTQFKHTHSILVLRDWLFKIHNFDDTHREWELFYSRWDGWVRWVVN